MERFQLPSWLTAQFFDEIVMNSTISSKLQKAKKKISVQNFCHKAADPPPSFFVMSLYGP